MDKRPIGIIRTLPSLYADKKEVGEQRYRVSLRMLNAGKVPAIYIALDKKPIHEVLYIYLIVNGKVDVRMNIAGYVSGAETDVKCWDDQYRTPNWWVLCSGPVVTPPAEIKWRGFQGFRYVYEELW